MKTEWICTWQLAPGGQKYTASYPSQSEARKAMAMILADAVDLQEYIHALRNDEGEDCGSSADFPERFLSDLTMPESESPGSSGRPGKFSPEKWNPPSILPSGAKDPITAPSGRIAPGICRSIPCSICIV